MSHTKHQRPNTKIWCLAFGVLAGRRWKSLGRFNPLALALVVCLPAVCLAQPKNPAPPPAPLERAEGEKVAHALIANLLSQKPEQNLTNTALVKIRGTDKKWREQPITFAVVVTPTNYLNIYETTSTNGASAHTLTIVHSDDRANQYWLSDSAGGAARKLGENELMKPFADSDFWIADLGVEFLHWPDQRVLKKEMRSSVSCDVLQSLNPHAMAGGYSRVVSWIGTSHPDEFVLVHADGYDEHGKLMRWFEPKSLEKVNGAYQLESMEMRNAQTGTRTIIEFNLEKHPAP